jgi:hypothetical protein
MNKILVITDHSTAAHDAMQYGIKLADAFQARVVGKDVAEGVTADAILAIAAEFDADLIIAGMEKHGREGGCLFGSTITALAKKTTVPLLVVPEGCDFIIPSKIVLANDLVLKMAIQIPEFVLALSAQFQSKLYIVRFLNNHAGELIEVLDYSEHFRRITGVISPLYELPDNSKEELSLSKYVSDHHFSLVAMPFHPQSLAEKWLKETPAGKMILESHVPLLILPEAAWY